MTAFSFYCANIFRQYYLRNRDAINVYSITDKNSHHSRHLQVDSIIYVNGIPCEDFL